MLFSFYLCCLKRMIWNLDSSKGIQGWILHKGDTKKATWRGLSSSLAQRDHLLTKLCISRFASVQNEKPFSVCRNIPFPRVSGLVLQFTGVPCSYVSLQQANRNLLWLTYENSNGICLRRYCSSLQDYGILRLSERQTPVSHCSVSSRKKKRTAQLANS